MAFSIQFIGATQTVTGSCFLVTAGNSRFLVDCGMYQGQDVEARNLEDFPFAAKDIDFVLLTHTHIDHSGLLPKLVRAGFGGQIYSTFHTAQLAEILLMDSAKIQEENFKLAKPWKHAGVVEMIYSTEDAQTAISLFEIVDFDAEFSPAPGFAITYRRAGHVLGAASLEVEHDGKVVTFSGDIGRLKQDLIPGFDPEYKREVDYVLMESLYGGQHHPNRGESVGQMMQIVRDTFERGGSVFIPCFAVQRSQEILNDFKLAAQSGALPAQARVWFDSPMGQKVTQIYSAALDHTEDSMFSFEKLGYVKNFRRSQKVSTQSGQVVIAGSGMAEGGRILPHFAKNLPNERNSVIFVGFQAEATLGRQLVDGAKEVEINDTAVKVRAQIHHLRGFSAHGDTDDYLAWLKRYVSPRLKQTFLIHAEEERMQDMVEILNSQQLDHPYIPKRGEIVHL